MKKQKAEFTYHLKQLIKEHYRLFLDNIEEIIYIHDTNGVLTYLNKYAEKISHYKINEIVGRHFDKIVAPESLKDALTAFKMQLRGRDVKSYALTVLDKNGERIYLKTNESVIRHQGKIIGVLGIATDITEHKKTIENLTEMMSRLTLLYDIDNELISITEPERFFFRILSHLKETFGYERCQILIIDETTNTIKTVASLGTYPNHLKNIGIKIGYGICGYVAETGKYYLTNDVTKDTHYIEFDKKTKSEICVPLKISGKIIGVINVESYKFGTFNENDVKILTLIANHAAIGIENGRLYKSLENSYLDTIKTLILAMEAKDPYTYGHSERVRKYAVKIAKGLKLSDEQVRDVNYAGYLHDIGKIGISDFLLTKKEPLTKSEYELIKQHPKIGHNILQGANHLSGASQIIKTEHERYDGTGYPIGLKKEEILTGARIIAVADAYDAMTTDRPYREALTKKEAIKRLKENTGTQFDPSVVRAFLKIIGRR